jgi:hypothetical protein
MSTPASLNNLVSDLLLERYGPRPTAERKASPVTMQAMGGADTDLATARRRRDLCEALEDIPQNYRRGTKAAA